MKNWPKIQYNQVQFGINASLEINEKACDCSLFTGRRYVPNIRAKRICEIFLFSKISIDVHSDSGVTPSWSTILVEN